MPVLQTEAEPTGLTETPTARPVALDPVWFGARGDAAKLVQFGFRLAGGGAHQSKTMMLQELEVLVATELTSGEELRAAVIDGNVLGKPTRNTRKVTFRHVGSLYGLVDQPPLTKAFLGVWRTHPHGHQLQALLVALARDPLLRETARVVTDGAVGNKLQRPLFEEVLRSVFPDRFSDKMVRSLAQNCASSWTQSGHLKGAVKKLRQRVTPTPPTVAFAALIATASGFGGPAMLSSGWMKVLDLAPEQALDALRRAEAIGLARVRSAGDVTEISVRQPMAAALGVPELEHV